ncbi:MAG: M20/M25/M40 family metallo-hydrolase [Candidatus Krumholzibacteriia bacterium]
MSDRSRVDVGSLKRYVDSSRAEFEDRLGALVEIPTVSMDPEREADIQNGAELATQYIQDVGGQAQIVPTAGHPVVVGHLDVGAPRTLTIYNHMDVQPASIEDGWEHEPFVFRKADGRYEGRGTTDDKGPALAALLAARYAVDNGIPLNIRFLWEFEEEIGSPHFEGFLEGRRAELGTHSILVSDTIWIARGKPAISTGLRGLQGALLRLETGSRDVHSGLTGGAARNPLAELAALVGECVDVRTGRVKIKGFYDDVVRLKKTEIDSFLGSGFRAGAFKAAHGLHKLRSTDRRQLVEGIWAKPTFEVHGFVGGYTGPGVKTAIPPRAELKISMRLVPDQKPARILKLLRQHVRSRNPDVRVIADAALAPYRGQFAGPWAEAASRAMLFGFGKKPALVREGGSIGAVVTMEKHLRAPITFIGLSLPEHGYHAPNENFDWGQASGGMQAFVAYFDAVSRM